MELSEAIDRRVDPAASRRRLSLSVHEIWRPAFPGAVHRIQLPVRRWQFWLAAALIVAISIAHAGLETNEVFGMLGPAYLFSVSLLIVPVIYAAMIFGLRGSLPAALLGVLVMLPNLVADFSEAGRVGEAWELGIVVIAGIFAGRRVDHEKSARADAERREVARQASEQRYRLLFDRAPAPVLLLDPAGVVEEANGAAARLLDRSLGAVAGSRIQDLVGVAAAEVLLGRTEPELIEISSANGRAWVEPITAAYTTRDGASRIQAILLDVTEMQQRQAATEAYARITVAAREDERRRIAMDLHDGPLQSLVVLWRLLAGIDRHPESADGQQLAKASSLALRVAEELRKTSQELRPAVLDDLGLAAALRAECRAVQERTGLRIAFRLSGDAAELPPEIELMILRVTQEALRNVERHARADAVVVALAFRPASVRLSIADDGKGMRTVPSNTELLASGRLGIVGMVERARLLGATCRVRTPRGGGVVVEVTVPSMIHELAAAG